MIGLLLLFLAATMVCTFFFYRKAARCEKELSQLRKERIQMNEAFVQVRSERHDFLKHIAAVQFMLETKKSAEAAAYTDTLIDGYKETNVSIQGEKGAVAGILHHMFCRAKNSDIDITYDLAIPLSSLPMPETDLVVLIGNILENSIEACEAWKEEKQIQKRPSIILQLSKRSGLYLLTCTNSSPVLPPRMTDRLFKREGITTKGRKHKGTGTFIIMRCVKKYDGFLDFVHKDELFSLKIKVPDIVTDDVLKK